MPSLKRKTSHVKESGFSIYTGEEPKAGVYRAEIIGSKMRLSKNDNLYFNVFCKLVGNEGSKAEFNGWTGYAMITIGDKDALIQRERNFYKAVCGKEDVDVVYNPIESSGNDAGVVTKIGGVKPDGKQCLVSIRLEPYNGAMQSRINDILPLADGSANKASNTNDTSDDLVEEDDDLLEEDEVEEDDEEDDEEDEDEEDEDEDDEETDALPRDQFESLSIVKLRKKALETFSEDISKDDLKGLSKDEILEYLEEEGLITPF